MTKKIWGTKEKPLTGYTCGMLHSYYESMGTVRAKEDELFPELNKKMADKYKGRINN